MEHPDENQLAAYLENTLTAKKRAEVEEHLASCETCRSVLSVYASSMSRMRSAAPAPKATRPKWIVPMAAVFLLGLTLFLVWQSREPPVNKQTSLKPPGPGVDESYLAQRGGKKVIDAKTFGFRNGIWIDQDYESAGKPAFVEVSRSSAAFTELVAAKPALRRYAEAGRVVVVFLDKKAYKFTP